MENTVTLEVCGQNFPICADTIEQGPSSRLTNLYKTGLSHGKSERIIVNRPAESFAAILAFYQTGELHIPMTSCPGAFLNELEFWEISPEALSRCCYQRLQSFLDEQETVRKFKEKQKNGLTDSSAKYTNRFMKCRAKIWEILEYTKPSMIGKLYLFLNIVMVLASIFTLAVSTDPIFKRTMTNCERLEYMISSDMDGFEIIQPYLQELCEETDLSELTPELIKKLNRSDYFKIVPNKDEQESEHMTFKFSIKRLSKTQERKSVPKPPDNRKKPETKLNKVTNTSSEKKDLVLPAAVSETFTYDNGFVTVPNLKTKILYLTISEIVTTIFFSIELILRLCTCPSLKVYFLSIINFSDAMSLIGAYLYIILYITYPSLRYGSWIDYLAYLQMLRSLRLFRVVSTIRAGKVLMHSLQQNIKDLFILVFFLFSGMCTFASCIYIAEDNPDIQSIPDAWYLSVITMTTVGYGDIHPQTKLGRFICCVCAVAGVLLLALTVPIFANHFIVLYNHAESEDIIKEYLTKKEKEKKKRERKCTSKKEGTFEQYF